MTALNTTEQYSLRWNNFHENLSVGFHSLLQACDLVDVTLAVDGHILKAHKLVLSICSPYFKKIFKQNPCTHPTIIIQDVSFGNVRDILNFMYSGEVNVTKDNLPSFLRTAELLQVKGLSGDDWDDSSRKNELSQVDNDDEIDSNYTGDDVDDSAMPVMDFIPTTLPTAARLLQPIQVPNEPPPVAPCRRSNSMFTSPASAKRKRTDNEFTNHHGAANSSPLNYSDGNLDSLRSESSIKKECQEQDFDSEIVPTKCEPNLLCTTDNDILQYHVDEKGHAYCPICFKEFVNRYNLKVHIRDKHDANASNLSCVLCGKTLRNKSCLRVHMYHHRKREELMQSVMLKNDTTTNR